MITILYVILAIIAILIISIISTPYIDNAVRFAKFKKITVEQLKKRFSTLKEEKPENFFYKMSSESTIYHVDYKLTMGGASDIYFEAEENKIKSILIVSRFNPEKWLIKIKKTYITNRNETHSIDKSFNYGKEIYKVIPKEYSSESLKKLFPTSKFDFGINHNKKFFMYFY